MTVARIRNKVYVGTDYAQAVIISAEILRLFPEWSQKCASRALPAESMPNAHLSSSFVTQYLPVIKYRRAAEKMLGPYIQERLNGKLDQNGQKPDDLVQRLIDAAPPIEKTVPQLAERVMALNVASIHTTTMVSVIP
ncbi:hypothetical protein FDECE_10366 [Fusarium decemcellulare]|nr:hypothetical protein FDECE_10366 [Fusarium decemcellulare]